RVRDSWCCRHEQGGTCGNLLIWLPLCPMGKTTGKSSANQSAAKKTTTASKKPDADANTPDSEEKSEFVEVVAETGDHVEPPPPEAVEPDPQMSPEEVEQARKEYLLTRFWISARGYWGRSGDRL